MVQKRIIFGMSFFGGLGALQVILGSFKRCSLRHCGLPDCRLPMHVTTLNLVLGPRLYVPNALLGILWNSKTLKTICFSLFLETHLFAALELLLALRGGAVLARLGPIWDPKGTPKEGSALYE